MSLTDTIANMLTLIRNANRAKHETVNVPFSNISKSIINILKEEGFIENYRVYEEGVKKSLRVYLRYLNNKEPVITDLKRISRSSRRIYVKQDEIPLVFRGRGIAVISTSKGIVTDKQAREMKIGGEVLCYVW